TKTRKVERVPVGSPKKPRPAELFSDPRNATRVNTRAGAAACVPVQKTLVGDKRTVTLTVNIQVRGGWQALVSVEEETTVRVRVTTHGGMFLSRRVLAFNMTRLLGSVALKRLTLVYYEVNTGGYFDNIIHDRYS